MSKSLFDEEDDVSDIFSNPSSASPVVGRDSIFKDEEDEEDGEVDVFGIRRPIPKPAAEQPEESVAAVQDDQGEGSTKQANPPTSAEDGDASEEAAAEAQAAPAPVKRNLVHERYEERLAMFRAVLQTERIDMERLRELAATGIPDTDGMRPTYWKVLLGTIPLDPTAWADVQTQNRALYATYVEELIDGPFRQRAESQTDNPLSEDDGAWAGVFRDEQILGEINKDVRRTYPDMHFFRDDDRHYDALQRALFIYAKLNPGICYVQGMNEIYAPIYYVLAHDTTLDNGKHAEPDAFFCFVALMSQIRDHFCQTLDASDSGIKGSLAHLMQLLKAGDHELWNNLKQKQLNPQFYGLRWLSLLLSQEFELPDLVRLWDSFFSAVDPHIFLLQFCCIMLMHVREELIEGDFGDNLKLLQSYPPASAKGPTDMNELLRCTRELIAKSSSCAKTAEAAEDFNAPPAQADPSTATPTSRAKWARDKAKSLLGWYTGK